MLLCCGLSMHGAQLQQHEEPEKRSSSFARDVLEDAKVILFRIAALQTAFIIGARNNVHIVNWAIGKQQALVSFIEKQKYLSFLEFKAVDYGVPAYMVGNIGHAVIPALFGVGCWLGAKYLNSKNKVQKYGLEKLQGNQQDEVSQQNHPLAAESANNE